MTRPLGYERVYLALYKEAGTPFNIQGEYVLRSNLLSIIPILFTSPCNVCVYISTTTHD